MSKLLIALLGIGVIIAAQTANAEIVREQSVVVPHDYPLQFHWDNSHPYNWAGNAATYLAPDAIFIHSKAQPFIVDFALKSNFEDYGTSVFLTESVNCNDFSAGWSLQVKYQGLDFSGPIISAMKNAHSGEMKMDTPQGDNRQSEILQYVCSHAKS
jgi:hypothetical protein